MSDLDIRLNIMISADGSIRKHNSIEMHFRKKRKIERCKKLLEEKNIPYNEHIAPDKSVVITFKNTNNYQKNLDIFWTASKEQLSIICEECMLWDGTIKNEFHKVYTTSNKENADLIQYAYSCNNIRCGIQIIEYENKNWNNSYRVYTTLNEIVRFPENKKIEKIPSLDGKKYCFTVPTGYFVIRRNNKISITGNCGVLTSVFKIDHELNFKELDTFINQKIPSGMTIRNGKHSALSNDVKLAIREIVEELKLGDLNKYLNSVGTLGGGNHYIEIGKINENTYALSVHTGSRNLGKKVCEHFQLKATEYIRGSKNIEFERKKLVSQLKNEHREKEIEEELKKLKNNSNYEIIGIPTDMAYIEGEDYDAYIRNMVKCQKMAAENRRLISLDILDFLNVKSLESFDTIHNYVELLENGNIVIRKGAISAKEGEKLAIPLNMRDGVIIGIGKGNDDWNQSAPHGAGRLMSRSKAKASVSMEEFQESMKGIQSWSVCNSTLDESPQAYKPASTIIEQVKETIEIIEIIKPVYNFKSHAETKSWSDIKKEEKAKKNQRGIDDESMDTNERDER